MTMPIISFGARKYNTDYDYAKYYNLNSQKKTSLTTEDSFDVPNEQKIVAYSSQYTPEQNYINPNYKNNIPQTTKKQKDVKAPIIATACGLILTSILGTSVAINSQNNKTKNYTFPNDNITTNSYSTKSNTQTTNEINQYKPNNINTDAIYTTDYIIGDTKQGKTADCWLLSTINSINETKKGKDFFKNIFDYNGDETVVHLYVGDYTVTNEELKIGRIRNSKGDDDVLLIELAVEKALADYNEGKVTLPQAVITEELGGKGTFSTLNMGSQDAAIYILTGRPAEYLKISKYEDKIDNYFRLFQTAEKENMSLTASIETDSTSYTNQTTGQTYFLKGHHAYCIKEVKDGYITLTNPDNSSINIEMDIDSFKEIFSSVTYADINNII